jgi:hypothetical protein
MPQAERESLAGDARLAEEKEQAEKQAKGF